MLKTNRDWGKSPRGFFNSFRLPKLKDLNKKTPGKENSLTSKTILLEFPIGRKTAIKHANKVIESQFETVFIRREENLSTFRQVCSRMLECSERRGGLEKNYKSQLRSRTNQKLEVKKQNRTIEPLIDENFTVQRWNDKQGEEGQLSQLILQ